MSLKANEIREESYISANTTYTKINHVIHVFLSKLSRGSTYDPSCHPGPQALVSQQVRITIMNNHVQEDILPKKVKINIFLTKKKRRVTIEKITTNSAQEIQPPPATSCIDGSF